jgi:hypothetical protein
MHSILSVKGKKVMPFNDLDELLLLLQVGEIVAESFIIFLNDIYKRVCYHLLYILFPPGKPPPLSKLLISATLRPSA